MRRYYTRFLISLLLLIAVPEANLWADTGLPLTLDKALNALDGAIETRGVVLGQARLQADSLRKELSAPGLDYESRMGLLDEIIGVYRRRNLDSANHCIDEALRLAREHGDTLRATALRISQIRIMPLNGYVHEAIMCIDSLRRVKLDDGLKKMYYRNARDAYLWITSLYSPHGLNDEYFKYYIEFNDSLLNVTPADAPEYKLLTGVHYVGEGQTSLALATLGDYLESVPIASDEFNDAAPILALINYKRERMDLWLYYLALHAHSEMLLGYIDGEALKQLSAGLYYKGDVNRAYNYMFLSQENLAMSGATSRSMHVAGVYPMIVKAYASSQRRYMTMLYVAIACLVLIGALILIIIANKSRAVKRLSSMKEKLSNANSIKEDYIAEFMSLCSVYMDKLEDFNRTVGRKIAAGQVDDLYNMVKSGKFVDEQSKLFYDVFDNAFINIYPDFVEEVNGLLQDDKRFTDFDSKKLTPELRILAFMRIGLDDSAQMARFLGLSLNTVYTYRNRLKSRAKNRETFEQDVRNVCSVK